MPKHPGFSDNKTPRERVEFVQAEAYDLARRIARTDESTRLLLAKTITLVEVLATTLLQVDRPEPEE